MTEQELIDAWRVDFEKFHGSQAMLPNGRYANAFDQSMWASWCAAKNSQPVVELPNVEHTSAAFERGFYAAVECFSSAGIKYVIKG